MSKVNTKIVIDAERYDWFESIKADFEKKFSGTYVQETYEFTSDGLPPSFWWDTKGYKFNNELRSEQNAEEVLPNGSQLKIQTDSYPSDAIDWLWEQLKAKTLQTQIVVTYVDDELSKCGAVRWVHDITNPNANAGTGKIPEWDLRDKHCDINDIEEKYDRLYYKDFEDKPIYELAIYNRIFNRNLEEDRKQLDNDSAEEEEYKIRLRRVVDLIHYEFVSFNDITWAMVEHEYYLKRAGKIWEKLEAEES